MSDAVPLRTSVRSADGTEIAVEATGTGAPVVVVHGSLADATDWQPVAGALADVATVSAFDRRGRGRSGLGEPHSMTREVEDVAAVRVRAGDDPIVLAHSYGAVVALEDALRHPPRALVVYEPPLPVDGPVGGSALVEYERAVQEGRPEDALVIGMVHFVGVPRDLVEQLRPVMPWDHLVALAPTWGREIRALDAVDPDLSRFARLDVPVIALVGELSPPWLVSVSERLVAALPQGRLVRIPQQGHDAHATAPSEVAGPVRDLLARDGPG